MDNDLVDGLMIDDKIERREKLLATLASENPPDYNILKFAEELAEVQEQLIKLLTKPSREERTMDNLLHEIADMVLRMEVFVRQKRIEEEVDHYYAEKIDYLLSKLGDYQRV